MPLWHTFHDRDLQDGSSTESTATAADCPLVVDAKWQEKWRTGRFEETVQTRRRGKSASSIGASLIEVDGERSCSLIWHLLWIDLIRLAIKRLRERAFLAGNLDRRPFPGIVVLCQNPPACQQASENHLYT